MERDLVAVSSTGKPRSSRRLALLLGAVVLAWYLAAMWMMRP